METIDKPMTASAFAVLTGIGVWTVRKAIASGDLKTFEFAGRTLILPSEVERILKLKENRNEK